MIRSPWARYLARRRLRRFVAWLETRPDVKQKINATARDLAEHGSLTIEEATARLTKAMQTPSDRSWHNHHANGTRPG